jgi:hypothetical protein
MTSNGTLQDGCDERHDVPFRKRWRCLLRGTRVTLAIGRPLPVYPGQQTFSESVGNRNHSNYFGSRHPADLSKSARRMTHVWRRDGACTRSAAGKEACPDSAVDAYAACCDGGTFRA